MEQDFSHEIANSKSTRNFFSAIESILDEYQAEGLTREESIKRFCKENNERRKNK